MTPLEHNPPQPVGAMILMHGLGASGGDLFPLAEVFAAGRLRVVCPHAPVRLVTVNGGFPMPAWYDIVGVDLQSRQDVAGLAASRAVIEELLAAEKARGMRAEQIFLAGFSQGGALALHVGLRHEEQLAGIIAMSGYLPFADDNNDYTAANRRTPVFMAHGEYDPVVLPQWARASRDVLKREKYPLTYCEYPTMHAIAQEEIADINRWLDERLADTSRS